MKRGSQHRRILSKRLMALGAEIVIEPGAGTALRPITDEAYQAAGATLSTAIYRGSGHRPQGAASAAGGGIAHEAWRGTMLLAMLAPHQNPGDLAGYAAQGITAFAMELIPRITRAQAMDVLSSQSNLSGYKAVIDAAEAFGRAFPMMMTAAGTIAPARVTVMGAGVAGLQAIATARRLGAIVSATDVRAASKEQVESLGATFITVEGAGNAETKGGYATEMSAEFQQRQRAKIAEVVAKQDIVICTALIPGRKAPILVTSEMVASMKAGSVLVDLAVEQGGNVEGSRFGEIGDDRQRRDHPRPGQHALTHRDRCQRALCPQSGELRHPSDRQGRARRSASTRPTRSSRARC